MQSQKESTSHNLYNLYASLPNATQQEFLRELLQKQHQQLDIAFHLACKQAKDENEFLSEVEVSSFIDSLSQ